MGFIINKDVRGYGVWQDAKDWKKWSALEYFVTKEQAIAHGRRLEKQVYYNNELGNLTDTDFYKTIIISDGSGNRTKNLDLNNHSIDALLLWLKAEKDKLNKGGIHE